MNKSTLIALVAASYPQLTLRDTDASVNVLIGEIAAAVLRGQRVEIRGFGSFFTISRPARVGRNPKTGEKVRVCAKQIPQFRCSKQMSILIQKKRPTVVDASCSGTPGDGVIFLAAH